MNVVTRFAPSPTGYLHVGNYRTAVFAYIFALQNKGKFILRIEDSDRARSLKEYEENIIESLAWLNIRYDELHRQSDRTDIHRSYIKKLIDGGHAYISKETPLKEGDRAEVIRFKNPNIKIRFNDIIRGEIEFDTTEQADFIIARSMEEPVFHLAVVVDDHDMRVTHVIRGEDHISNTARHILIQKALGFETPQYAHVPLLLTADRSKLSKRKGSLSITAYRDLGYMPEALMNHMSLLGWNPGNDKEILSTDDIIKQFRLDKIQKSAAIFDEEKLRWFNRQYLMMLTDADFVDRAKTFIPEWLLSTSDTFQRMLPLIRDKIHVFADIPPLFENGNELAFVKKPPPYDKESLLWKKDPNPETAMTHLKKGRELLEKINERDFTDTAVKAALWSYAETNGKGNVLWPLRFALTGQDKSPDPFVSAAILGKKTSLARIDEALKKMAA